MYTAEHFASICGPSVTALLDIAPSRIEAGATCAGFGQPPGQARGATSARPTKASTIVLAMRSNIGPAALVISALSNS